MVSLFVPLALLLNDSLLCQSLYGTFWHVHVKTGMVLFCLMLVGLNLNGFQKCIGRAAIHVCVIKRMHPCGVHYKVFLVVLRAELSAPKIYKSPLSTVFGVPARV